MANVFVLDRIKPEFLSEVGFDYAKGKLFLSSTERFTGHNLSILQNILSNKNLKKVQGVNKHLAFCLLGGSDQVLSPIEVEVVRVVLYSRISPIFKNFYVQIDVDNFSDDASEQTLNQAEVDFDHILKKGQQLSDPLLEVDQNACTFPIVKCYNHRAYRALREALIPEDPQWGDSLLFGSKMIGSPDVAPHWGPMKKPRPATKTTLPDNLHRFANGEPPPFSDAEIKFIYQSAVDQSGEPQNPGKSFILISFSYCDLTIVSFSCRYVYFDCLVYSFFLFLDDKC